MSAIHEQLERQIERALEAATFDTAAFDGAFPEDLETLRSLFASGGESMETQGGLEAAASELASDPEMVQEFLVESREHLADIENGILALEQEPEDAESLNCVFRSFHTIKALAGFLGASAIHELAHETENVLGLARSGPSGISADMIDLIFRAADELARCLDECRTQNLADVPGCDKHLLASLASAGNLQSTSFTGIQTIGVPGMSAPRAPAHIGRNALPSETTAPGGNEEGSTVRIETAKLDYLIDMVGKLVTAESVVRDHPAISDSIDPLLSRNLGQLTRVIQEIRKTSMSMRIVVAGTMFRKMNRLTRDLARKSGKIIELITAGDDLELDRSIVEGLADPIMHMIRNAVDHGLETPDERRRVGKPEKGIIRLQAMQDAGEIAIEISDDGRGMDPQRILAKAERLGMVDRGESLDEESIFRFIFEPGFSTVEKVTEISGRGVGMDLVEKQIRKLRGHIEIRSTRGKGCTFVLRLPCCLGNASRRPFSGTSCCPWSGFQD